MFFILSKTLGVLLLPTNFLIAIGFVGTILLLTRFARVGRKLVTASVLLLLICGLSPLGNLLLYPLEQRFPPWESGRSAPDGIIVLGASIEPDLSVAHGTPVVRSAPDRILAAAALAYRYPDARIVFSGGSANLISNDAKEADFAGAIFESLGVARSRLIMERASRNSQENAAFTRALVAPKDGESNAIVNGFYAIGECACVSVHGANRLGTNSLLDLLVFGRAAGNHIVEFNRANVEHKPLPRDAADRALARLARLDSPAPASGAERTQDVANALRKVMQAHCGVFRNRELLAAGVEKVAEIAQRVARIAIGDKSKVFNTARIEALEVENLIEVARATIGSALAREESRGAHARSDFDRRDDVNWLKHSLWYSAGDRLDYKAVRMKPLSVDSFPPKARTF